MGVRVPPSAPINSNDTNALLNPTRWVFLGEFQPEHDEADGRESSSRRPGGVFVRLALRGLLLASLCLVAAHCGGGGSDSPTSPTSPTSLSAASGSLSIENLTVQASGPPGDVTYRLSMRLRETGGSVGITLTTLGMSLDGNRSATVPLDPIKMTPGRQEPIGPIAFNDKSGPASSRMTIAIGYRDDNGRGGSANATTAVENLALVTLSGMVTDRATGRPIAGATARVQSGVNEGKSARTDANGIYAMGPLVAGAFRVAYDAVNYTTQSHPIDIGTDAAWNVALERDPPDVEYTITGSARTCSVFYESGAGSTSSARVTLPWSYSRSARAGDFLYVSCQIDSGGDTGSIFVRINRNGSLFRSASASGFANIATASGTY